MLKKIKKSLSSLKKYSEKSKNLIFFLATFQLSSRNSFELAEEGD